jgi:hypothetical protein
LPDRNPKTETAARREAGSVISLESHRRQRMAESRRKAAKAKAGPSHERAINWRRAPLFLAAVALFMLFSWLVHYAGGLMTLFH